MGLGLGLSLWGSTVGHPQCQLGFLLNFAHHYNVGMHPTLTENPLNHFTAMEN